MKTQISRDGFRADRRYSGVYQQQGRMITDRDWNELVDILKTRVDDALVDVVGVGSPQERAMRLGVDNGVPKIAAGVVYAGGATARVDAAAGASPTSFDLDEQADFPSPPPLPGGEWAARFYVDVWERPVVSLEDADLRDPALHGADTTTRTQTMAQVKWCSPSQDPESPAVNPGRGNATLTLAFPQAAAQGGQDPCDPQVGEIDPVGGDFLFRVEVHDVRWPGNAGNAAPGAPNRVVVKWSRENGAEQFPFKEMPDWFKAGASIFELFDLESEKHLGFHMSGGDWEPRRGTFVTSLPQIAPEGTMVRRWDGYCVLVRSGSAGAWSFSAAEAPETTAPGATLRVSNGSRLTVNLMDLEFTLDVQGKVFLPGDYWLAPVRQATFAPGVKLLDAAQPLGILHRYVALDRAASSGVAERKASEQRRLAFPRLTDLGAADVGYEADTSSGLFTAGHDTVQKALDRLSELSAVHVGFTKTCNRSVFRDANPKTVAEALGLLCDLRAGHVAYQNEDFEQLDDVATALDFLFSRSAGSGNRATVGDDGDYQTIQEAISDLRSTGFVALALRPGTHQLSAFDTSNLAGVHLSIAGLGLASRVEVISELTFARLDLFELDNVAIDLIGVRLLLDDCRSVVLKDSQIEGSYFFSAELDEQALVEHSSLSGNHRVLMRGCTLDVQPRKPDPYVSFLLGSLPEDAGDLYAVGISRFRSRVRILAGSIGGQHPLIRLQIAQELRRRLSEGPGEGPPPPDTSFNVQPEAVPGWSDANLSPGVNAAYSEIVSRIEAGAFDAALLTDAFERLRRAFMFEDPGAALGFRQGWASVLLDGNEFHGRIGLYGSPAPEIDINLLSLWNKHKNNRVQLLSPGGDFRAVNNRLIGVRISSGLLGLLRDIAMTPQITSQVNDLFRSVELTDNRFDVPENMIVAQVIQLTSCELGGGWALANLGSYVGNRAPGSSSAILNDLTKSSVEAASLLPFDVVRFP